jgi:acyl-CoA hydrolase
MTEHEAIDKEYGERQTIFIDQVFPSMVNHYGTLFGGIALQWMDKAAWVISTRYARRTMVTVAVDQITFKEPIPLGSMVELRAKVERVGRTSITVVVETYCEHPLTGKQKLATTGKFVMVALDEDGAPSVIERS